MPAIKRSTQTNIHGYREVSLDYRIARSAALDAKQIGAKTGRIACPMVEASRSESAYGRMALAATDKKHLDEWTRAIGIGSLGIKSIAYLSGPLSKILRNVIHGRFDDKAINTGLIRSIKHGVNTGVLAQSSFSQEAMNTFVWSFHPELKDLEISQEWLYSEAGATLYLDHTLIPKVVAYNRANAKASKIKTWLGTKMSGFEMTQLLVGVLAQEIVLDKSKPKKTVKAILVRDIYDLYKYGWIPALVEEKLAAAGLLNIDTLVGTSTP